ncbi:MAG: universal stress protein [Nitrososphaerales archaeon]
MSDEISIKKILLPIDGSEVSLRAAKFAIKIAKTEKSKIICIHAICTPTYIPGNASPASYYLEARKLAEIWLGHAVELARKEGVDLSTEIVVDAASAVDAIANYAANEDADLIVIGTRGRTGVKRFLLGSVANGVVMHAECPVLVVR